MDIYLFRHKRVPVSYIRCSRHGLVETSTTFKNELYSSLSKRLRRYMYQSGEYPEIFRFLDENDLFLEGVDRKGLWRKDWPYRKVLSGVTIQGLLNKTKDLVKLAQEDNCFVLNTTLPWNHSTILRDRTGVWLGYIEPERYRGSSLNEDYNQRRVSLSKRIRQGELKNSDEYVEALRDFRRSVHRDRPNEPKKKLRFPRKRETLVERQEPEPTRTPPKPLLNPFERVFGS